MDMDYQEKLKIKTNLLKYFDWEFYLSFYSDLGEVYSTEKEAIYHYMQYGYNEGRLGSDNVSYSIVIACKDRMPNLLKILPTWINANYHIKEIIIVDYSSKFPISENLSIKKIISQQKTEEYIKIIRVDGEEKWNLGKAFNLGIDVAQYSFIIKVDTDYSLKDNSFLEYLDYRMLPHVFVRGDHNFPGSDSLTGFCIFPNIDLIRYKEDLNGWGYDDIHFYNKLEKYLKLTPIYFFNISQYIDHLYHPLTMNGESNEANKTLCRVPHPSIRHTYSVNRQNHIEYTKTEKPIDKIFCINCEDRKDRWEKIKDSKFSENNIPVTRFPAVISESGQELSYQPANLDTIIYMHFCPKAFGTFLSHYRLWQHIVKNKISRCIILEDDIDVDSLHSFFNSNYIFDRNIHLTNLSKRFRTEPPQNTSSRYPSFKVFDGAESYILTYLGAKILIGAVNHPSIFNSLRLNLINHNGNVHDIPDKRIVNKKFDLINKPSIIAPVDKFIGYCCSHPDIMAIHTYLYPMINLDYELAEKSDLSDYSNPCWEMTGEELGKLDIFNKF